MFLILFESEKIMNLESLSNELLFDLLGFLNVINLFRAFHGLNNLLDQLIFTIIQLYHFDFRSISKHDFDLACQQYLLSLIYRVISCHMVIIPISLLI